MTYQEAANALCNAFSENPCGCEACPLIIDIDRDGIAICGLERCKRENEWHKLRNGNAKTPHNNETVLIKSDDGEYSVGYYCAEREAWELLNPDRNLDWDYVEAEDAMVTVTAWRYIEPFKEEE